jgi:hypothetical protein
VEAMRLADNDSSILLRNLAIKIQKFEVNRLNDFRVADLLNNICLLGKKVEEKIHENFTFKSDQCVFNENKEYLEECYARFIHIRDRK